MKKKKFRERKDKKEKVFKLLYLIFPPKFILILGPNPALIKIIIIITMKKKKKTRQPRLFSLKLKQEVQKPK
jgi:hypothetical protein